MFSVNYVVNVSVVNSLVYEVEVLAPHAQPSSPFSSGLVTGQDRVSCEAYSKLSQTE